MELYSNVSVIHDIVASTFFFEEDIKLPISFLIFSWPTILTSIQVRAVFTLIDFLNSYSAFGDMLLL